MGLHSTNTSKMNKLKHDFDENPEQFVDLFFECLWTRDQTVKTYFTSVGMRRLKTMFVNAFPQIIEGSYDVAHLQTVHNNIQLKPAQLDEVVGAIVDAVEYNSPLEDPEKAEITGIKENLAKFLLQ